MVVDALAEEGLRMWGYMHNTRDRRSCHHHEDADAKWIRQLTRSGPSGRARRRPKTQNIRYLQNSEGIPALDSGFGAVAGVCRRRAKLIIKQLHNRTSCVSKYTKGPALISRPNKLFKFCDGSQYSTKLLLSQTSVIPGDKIVSN